MAALPEVRELGRVTGLDEARVDPRVGVDRDAAIAPVGRRDEPEHAALVGVAERFLLVAGLDRPFLGVTSQICRKCTPSVFDALSSLCITPVPALIRWTSPGRITAPVPIESL